MGSLHRPDYYGLGSQRGRARRRGGLRGSMRLGALFAVLVGINIYVFFFRGGTSIHDVLKTSAIEKKKGPRAGASHASAAEKSRETSQSRPAPEDDSVLVQGGLKGHLGISGALQASKIDGAQVTELVTALGAELNLRSLRPEHTFEARLDPKTGQIRRFVYKTSPVTSIEVTRDVRGVLRAKKLESKLTTKLVRVGGKVESSLNASMSKAGETSALVAAFVELFSWDINWYADPREGDEFRIVVEKQYLGASFYRYGKILAAEYRGKVGRFQTYHFKPSSGVAGYYVPEGRALRREFLKTPLNFRRLTSKYNTKRFHPVLHTTKGHYGVDYAAPTGTPVWAASDGKVLTVARAGGAGNMVVLSHAGNVSTMYMHLSRFAAGLKAGQKVKQRTLIGYVGCTGLCTGPHLHYGIKSGGRYIDPLKFNPRKGEMLPRADRIRFLDQLPDRIAELEGIPVTAATLSKAPAKAAASDEE